jgi:hypothetical protein
MIWVGPTPGGRQIDNIPTKQECIVMAESFIKAAQLTPYHVGYSCLEHPTREAIINMNKKPVLNFTHSLRGMT